MGQGQDKIAKSLLDLQPTAVLEFYLLYPDTLLKPSTYIAVHNGTFFDKNVNWQGISYSPMPIETEGFEMNGNGKLARPKIRFANKDYLVTSLLQNNQDFKNAKVTRKKTFLKYIDDDNFDGGNPFGDSDSTAEISSEDYIISQKIAENQLFVEFELTSPLDLDNFEINHRKIIAKYCYWQYRGNGCNYLGFPIQQENGDSFRDPLNSDNTSNYVIPVNQDSVNGFDGNLNLEWKPSNNYKKGNICYMENPKIIINAYPGSADMTPKKMKNWYVCVQDGINKNPELETNYWKKDGCRKDLKACKSRFNEDSANAYIQATVSKSENFIGFMGTSNPNDSAKLYTTDTGVLSALNGNFNVGLWFSGANPVDGSALLSTTLNKSQETAIPQRHAIDKNSTYFGPDIIGDSLDNADSLNINTWGKDLKIHFKIDRLSSYERINQSIGSIAYGSLNFIDIDVQRNLSSPHNYLRYSEDFKSNSFWNNQHIGVFNPDATGTKVAVPDYNNVPYEVAINNVKNFDGAGIDSSDKGWGQLMKYYFSSSLFSTDIKAKHPWGYYGAGTTFSIYVKKPNSNPYNFFYIKQKIVTGFNDQSSTLSRHVVFDLTKKTFTGRLGLDYMYPEIKDVGNGWLRLKVTAYNDLQTPIYYLNGIYFGPMAGTTSGIYSIDPVDTVLSINQEKNYAILGYFNNSTASGIYISGAQLENGMYARSYIKTTTSSYTGEDFNLDGVDSINVYNNDQLQYSWFSKNNNELLYMNPEQFSLGGGNIISDGNMRSISGNIASCTLWKRSLTGSEISSLYKPIVSNNYYPLKYEDCSDNLTGTGSSLVGWWDMVSDPSKATQTSIEIKNLATSSLNYLKTSGTKYNLTTSTYSEYEASSSLKMTELTNLHFGGFPGTDEFYYAN